MVSKKYEWKNIVPLNRKSVATGCNKGFGENIVPRYGKTASSRTKWFPLARKSVSISQNKGLVL